MNAYEETAAQEKEVKSEEAPKVPKEAAKPMVHPRTVCLVLSIQEEKAEKAEKAEKEEPEACMRRYSSLLSVHYQITIKLLSDFEKDCLRLAGGGSQRGNKVRSPKLQHVFGGNPIAKSEACVAAVFAVCHAHSAFPLSRSQLNSARQHEIEVCQGGNA